jgi:YebC/PmpR family DNA-binding regulatory protein
MGGSDIATNPRLRLVVDKGLSANMPKDTVERAIKRGAGELEGVQYEQVRYEGYGPGGVAVMVDCLTDNRNRTVAEVRHAFSKSGGNLGTDGSVAYLFEKRGIISFPPGSDEDRIMDVALEAGAEDISGNDDGSIDVITDPDQFVDIKEALAAAGLTTDIAEVTMRPNTTAEIDKETTEKLFRLTDMLEELDDAQDVYHNADISDEILEQLSG